ncbi:hypothetical protein DPV78_007886 [Talaromyces pinophilus]|nr:hypothetical protein DPV78_007886 [Talaromyces pinophilus]
MTIVKVYIGRMLQLLGIELAMLILLCRVEAHPSWHTAFDMLNLDLGLPDPLLCGIAHNEHQLSPTKETSRASPGRGGAGYSTVSKPFVDVTEHNGKGQLTVRLVFTSIRRWNS